MELLLSLKDMYIKIFGISIHSRFIVLPIVAVLIFFIIKYLTDKYFPPKRYYTKILTFKPEIPIEVAQNHYAMWDFISRIENLYEEIKLRGISTIKRDYLNNNNFSNIKGNCFLCEEFSLGGFCGNCPLDIKGYCLLYNKLQISTTNEETVKLAKQIRDSVLL